MYSSDFYSSRNAATAHAAKVILGMVLDTIPVQSVCDVGCGAGTWVKVAREMGIHDALGFEGAWVEDSQLVVESERIRRQDLEHAIRCDRRFDLAICLEVAEHLSKTRGPGLVSDLCQLADVVLFSAAVPDQRGTGHVNEQWQSYWASLFEKHSYVAFDLVRPGIWSDDSIPYWYRQNTLLYVTRNSEAYERLKVHAAPPVILDITHPVSFARKEHPTVGLAAMRLARAVYRRQWR